MPADPPTPLDPGGRVKRSNSTFSEHGHVTYQIKGNHECSNMMQLFCPQTPTHTHSPLPRPWGWCHYVKNHYFFSEHGYVAYQIKLIHEYTNMVANILPTDFPPPSRPCGSRGQNSFFSEHDHVVYQIKGNHVCSNTVAIFSPHTQGVKMSKFNFFITWSCCISNLRESRMQQHGSKYLPADPSPLTLEVNVTS